MDKRLLLDYEKLKLVILSDNQLSEYAPQVNSDNQNFKKKTSLISGIDDINSYER